jgi:hypothetical protein
MYGPLVAAAAILLVIVGVLLLSDLSLSRIERAARPFDYLRNRAAHRR